MVEKLTRFWEKCGTRLLAEMFIDYMNGMGIKKYDGRRKDNTNTYDIDGDSTGWNRVQCYYHTDSTEYCTKNLLLVLRKEAGNYFIIQRKDKRAFEVDYSGVRHYDEGLLKEIMAEHKPLFDSMLSIVR